MSNETIGIQPVHPTWERIIHRHTKLVEGKDVANTSLYDTSWSKIMRIHDAMKAAQVEASNIDNAVSPADLEDAAPTIATVPKGATSDPGSTVAIASEIALEAIEAEDDAVDNQWSDEDCSQDGTVDNDAITNYDKAWDRVMAHPTPVLAPKPASHEPSALELPETQTHRQQEMERCKVYHAVIHDYSQQEAAQPRPEGFNRLHSQWVRIFSMLLAFCDLTQDAIDHKSGIDHKAIPTVELHPGPKESTVTRECKETSRQWRAWTGLKMLFDRLPLLALLVCSLIKKADLQEMELGGQEQLAVGPHTALWVMLACLAVQNSNQQKPQAMGLL